MLIKWRQLMTWICVTTIINIVNFMSAIDTNKKVLATNRMTLLGWLLQRTLKALCTIDFHVWRSLHMKSIKKFWWYGISHFNTTQICGYLIRNIFLSVYIDHVIFYHRRHDNWLLDIDSVQKKLCCFLCKRDWLRWFPSLNPHAKP